MWSIFRSDVFCPKEGDPREQINGVTAFIDGSSIYGSDDETAIGLRDTVTVAGQTIPAARLKTQKDSEQREALPSRSQCGFDSPQKAGSNPTPDDLTGGDGRAVVQPGLASIHTLFLHEHNRIVDALKQLWDSQASTKDLSAQSREEFIFEVWSPFVFSCPQQLNRWPCHWLTESLRVLLLLTLQSDPTDIWSEWWGNMTWPTCWQFFDNFDNCWHFLTIFNNFQQF